MANKIRVYEIAKKYNYSSKELIEKLNLEFGLEISSHMEAFEGEDLELITEYLEDINSKKDEAEEKTESKENIENIEKKHKSKKDSPKKETKAKKNVKTKKDTKIKETKKEIKKEKKKSNIIEIPETIIVREFADLLDVSVTTLITELMKNGVMANLNQSIDFDTAELVALSFDKEVGHEKPVDSKDILKTLDYEDDDEDLMPRPPVVTVMGHVDHGKTSLLDKIRETSVTKGEAGGITQHIGASVAQINGKDIVFLDTPGHEAFTEMRMRGAQATDLVILVVAADDGVMPQTVEAINHIKAANVPFIIAINKMDKYDANPDRIKQELMEYGVVAEEWGGDAITIPVSAKTGQGIDELLEMVLMVAELSELKANPNRNAIGTIIEAYLDKGLGSVATILVNKGTLRVGDYVVSGQISGKIRAMYNFRGENIEKVTPSYPALITGLSDVPEAGDLIYALEDEKEARNLAEEVRLKEREEELKAKSNVNLDDLFTKISDGEVKDLNIVLKTDVKGTIAAVEKSFSELNLDEVKVNIIHAAVGGINRSDVMLASASNAIIIGFNVRPNQDAIEQAEKQDIEIRAYRVIYEAIEDLQNAIKGMLDPEFKEKVIGRAEIRDIFKVPNIGNVAGIYVTNGKMERNASLRLLRNDIVIHEGKISSLRRFKDDVRELNQGYEGGLGIEGYNDIKVGDVVEAFVMKEIER